jgi:hypothetical protein
MVEDANEGTFGSPPPSGNFLRITPAASLGQLFYPVAPESQQAWDAADAAVKAIVEKDGLGQQLLWRGTRNVQCAHPWRPAGSATTRPPRPVTTGTSSAVTPASSSPMPRPSRRRSA